MEIMGLSEVRWPGSGKCTTDQGILYYSSNDGIEILLDKKIDKLVNNLVVGRLNLIQVDAPTADKSEDNKENYAKCKCKCKHFLN